MHYYQHYKHRKDRKYIIGSDKQHDHKIVNIFLSVSLNTCFGCSKEPSQFSFMQEKMSDFIPGQ